MTRTAEQNIEINKKMAEILKLPLPTDGNYPIVWFSLDSNGQLIEKKRTTNNV